MNHAVLGADIDFLPRAITYLSHLFPLRDDSTSFTFGRDENTTNKVNFLNLAKIVSLSETKTRKSSENEEYNAAYIDRAFWRDIPTHQHKSHFRDIEEVSAFHMANAALRRTEYNRKSCDDEDLQGFAGNRVIQTYVERGVPFQVPCYSCQMNQTGLTTVFYILPSRNFLDGINLQDRKDMFSNSSNGLVNTFSSWLLYEIKNHQKGGKFNFETQFVFGMGRGTGGHAPAHLQPIIGDEHGRLQINVVNMSYVVKSAQHEELVDRLSVYEKFYGGLTIICAQMVDNEPRSLGFVHNIDYLINAYNADLFFKESMEYDNYVVFNSSMSTLPYINITLNIKVAITWEEWSCCSACCCSVSLCGLYSNTKKCHEVESYRVRRGFLSILLLNPKKPLQLPNKDVSDELDRILRVSPYRENGIAIFSSFILSKPRFREHVWEDVLKNIIEDNLDESIGPMENTVGLFIEEQDCNEMPQKTNCSALAECRGQMVHEPSPEVEELVAVDPCATIPMTILSITENSASFRFEANSSYRLRLDGLDREISKTITWKIGGHPIASYDPLKPCYEQGIVVHSNGFDLILIEPNETKVVGLLIEASTSRHQFKIKFLLDKQEDRLLDEKRIIVEKAGIVAACVIAAVAVLVLIHSFIRGEKGIVTAEESKRKIDESENQGKRKVRNKHDRNK